MLTYFQKVKLNLVDIFFRRVHFSIFPIDFLMDNEKHQKKKKNYIKTVKIRFWQNLLPILISSQFRT